MQFAIFRALRAVNVLYTDLSDLGPPQLQSASIYRSQPTCLRLWANRTAAILIKRVYKKNQQHCIAAIIMKNFRLAYHHDRMIAQNITDQFGRINKCAKRATFEETAGTDN